LVRIQAKLSAKFAGRAARDAFEGSVETGQIAVPALKSNSRNRPLRVLQQLASVLGSEIGDFLLARAAGEGFEVGSEASKAHAETGGCLFQRLFSIELRFQLL